MGVFKWWLRRDRVTVTHASHSGQPVTPEEHVIGTIRTEEYKRDLAEFQARRSLGNKELPDTPVKKKCGRNSLPVSCTTCSSADHDTTFNYEKKSALKYKKKSHKRSRSATPNEKALPKIQFLFQNQVFMPGNYFTSSYSESQKYKRRPPCPSPEMDLRVQKHLDFSEDQNDSPPLFYKNNSLPYDAKEFLESSKIDEQEEVDGLKAAGDTALQGSSQSSLGAKDDSCEEKLWEVMSELKHFDQWADDQLHVPSGNVSKSDDNKSDTSAYGLPIASASNLDVNIDRGAVWASGKWGSVPVQLKKLEGVTIHQVKKKLNTEINILRKYRHPNIILLMGLYPDLHRNIQLICEKCVDSLHNILHEKGRILSVQTSLRYTLDIANALVFLSMQGFIHTELSSVSIMVTSHDTAKLADLGPCVKLPTPMAKKQRRYEIYSPEPQYVNIEDNLTSSDGEPLISASSSEVYLSSQAVSKPVDVYKGHKQYQWLAPELFQPDEQGIVYPCSRTDVYSLSLILWECCNATIPWKTFTYEKLKEQYILWKTGVRLPQDGTYPGALLALLQDGLKLTRHERIDLDTFQNTLQTVKQTLDEAEYIIIPARVSQKVSNFSNRSWNVTSPSDSDCQSPIKTGIQHKVVVHAQESSTESEIECSKSDNSPLYETIRKSSLTFSKAEKCFISFDDDKRVLNCERIQDMDNSSACSTPISKIKARIKDDTPGLHRSDSTEYCSILSPNRTLNFCINDENVRDQSGEKPTAKLSRSFTPKSYKPLHIKVPDCNLDSIKTLLKDQNASERSSYNFDIKNYSLPTTPIARSNKLRKNAWLSGDLNGGDRFTDQLTEGISKLNKEVSDCKSTQTSPETPVISINSSMERDHTSEKSSSKLYSSFNQSPESMDTARGFFSGNKKSDQQDILTPEIGEHRPDRTRTWSFKSNIVHPKSKVEEDVLANVNVRPLVAIHERWIYEATKKTGRSMSLPEDIKNQTQAVKPASHCVDTLQKSLPQLNVRRNSKTFRGHPPSPNGGHWEQFCQARDTIARNMNFASRDNDRYNTRRRDSDKGTCTDDDSRCETKIDRATDTQGIEEFIRDLIRKEFQHLLHEISDESVNTKTDDALSKGIANIVDNLKNADDTEPTLKSPVKSFSRVKINGNNKPLLHITFSRTGENSLHVLDNCVNVTICDKGAKDKMNHSMEDTLTDDAHVHGLKRCQAFNAIQEARSTEDLYIDDDISTQMQENFGGRVKLIPLHGSLHEILCEKEDDCCLLKVKQENGCDTVYFRCDNSDTDMVDGQDAQDTVLFKRSISVVQGIQRIIPRDRPKSKDQKRPKSEIFIKAINKDTRVLSNSSPSLIMKDKSDEVEVNIENAMCYDSSSEECIKCQVDNDDFELLERKIEEDLANNSLLNCGCLEKISEENLSLLNEDSKE